MNNTWKLIVVAVVSAFSVSANAGSFTVTWNQGGYTVNDIESLGTLNTNFGGMNSSESDSGFFLTPSSATGSLSRKASLKLTVIWTSDYAGETPPEHVYASYRVEANLFGSTGSTAQITDIDNNILSNTMGTAGTFQQLYTDSCPVELHTFDDGAVMGWITFDTDMLTASVGASVKERMVVTSVGTVQPVLHASDRRKVFSLLRRACTWLGKFVAG